MYDLCFIHKDEIPKYTTTTTNPGEKKNKGEKILKKKNNLT